MGCVRRDWNDPNRSCSVLRFSRPVWRSSKIRKRAAKSLGFSSGLRVFYPSATSLRLVRDAVTPSKTGAYGRMSIAAQMGSSAERGFKRGKRGRYSSVTANFTASLCNPMLTTCRHCGYKPIYSNAKVCPCCGGPAPSKITETIYGCGCLIVLAVIALIYLASRHQ